MPDSTEERYYLGIDLGTSSCKTVLADRDGNIVSRSANGYPLIIGPGGSAEQSPEAWWQSIVLGIREVCAKVDPNSVRAMGVTGQWSGTVPVDSDGKALHNAVIWMDTRGREQIRELISGFPSVSGYRIDKLMRWIRLTGGAPARSGKDSLAHILYIRERLPEIYSRTFKFLEPKDYIVFRLTGKFLASWDNVTLTWATDNRNASEVHYHKKLLETNGLEAIKLPDLVPSNHVVGDLTAQSAEEIGLPRSVRIVSGCGDIQSSLLGAGVVDDYRIHLYLGTSSWITAHVPFKKTDIFHSIASLPSAIPGKYFIPAEQENAGNCLEYVMKLTGLDGAGGYKVVDELCAGSEPGANGLLFLPWLYGERAPVEDPYLRGGFFNLGLQNSKGDLIRSVLEGIALNSRWLFESVVRFVGHAPDYVTMSGGGALSAVWPKIISDVLGIEVRVVEDPVYSGVRGAAMLAAWGSGDIEINAFGKLGRYVRTYVPDRNLATVYFNAFGTFKKYYVENRKTMRKYNSGDDRTSSKNKGNRN